jgi:hypothetical protein
MSFWYSGQLDGTDSIDKREREMTPGTRYRWTVRSSDTSMGRLHLLVRAPEPTESAMWEGGVVVIDDVTLSAGQTASGLFVVPTVHNRRGHTVSVTRVVFRFSRPFLGQRVGYSFSATRED